MSQPPDAPDPYLQPPSTQQPYPQQPYPQQQPYQAGPGAGPSGPPGGRSLEDVRRDKPPVVKRLVQLMWVGAVITVLIGAYGLLSVGSVVAGTTSQVEQDLQGSGLDASSFTDVVGPLAVASVVVTTVVSAALWALFAWLLSRGQGRVAGTVLGVINGVGTLAGLFFTVGIVDLLLQLLTLAVIVAALVLLWRPATTAWFRAVKAADPRNAWA